MNTSKFKYYLIGSIIGGTSVLIVLGGYLVIAGLVGNELRNTSNINRPTLEKIIFYGFPITISGLYLSILSIEVLYFTNDYLDLEELTGKGQIKISASCVGCRHFHGVQYNGILLTCAMHPSGAESKHCPDYEKCRSPTASFTLVMSTTRRLKRLCIRDVRPTLSVYPKTRFRIIATKPYKSTISLPGNGNQE
jgi:hypothetical protein